MLGFGKISKAPINDKIPTFKCHTSITILGDLDRPRVNRRTAMLFSHQISAKFPLPPNKHKHDDPTDDDHPPVFQQIVAVRSEFQCQPCVHHRSHPTVKNLNIQFQKLEREDRREKPKLYVSPFVSDSVLIAGVDSDHVATASDELFQIPSSATA